MVNILLSAYNGSRYIIEQLKSIEAQTYRDYHVYIRDDGSEDDTADIISDYIRKDPGRASRYTLIRGENLGFTMSFAELLHFADQGDYWSFCDQDDYWYPEKLERSVAWLDRQNQDIPLLYHGGFEIGNEDLSVRKEYRAKDFQYTFARSLASNIFFGFSIVINRTLRDMLLKAYFGHIAYHDWFAAMITAAFGRYHYSHTVESVHRQHSGNASPLYFIKKIPDGIKVLMGNDIYRANASEFLRLYGDRLQGRDLKLCRLFAKEHCTFKEACYKAFYPHRWNPQVKVELILRLLMLFRLI